MRLFLNLRAPFGLILGMLFGGLTCGAELSLSALLRRFDAPPAPGERLRAAESLAEYGATAIPALVERLRDGDDAVRSYACLALVRMGPAAAEAVPQLVVLLDDPQEYVRADALTALREIGPAAAPAVPVLAGILRSADRPLRLRALESLAAIRTPESCQALTAALDVHDRDLQRSTLKALQRLGPDAAAALPKLLHFAVTAQEPSLADEAFLAAGALGDVAVPELVVLLEAELPATRRRSALALSRAGASGEAAVPALQRAVRDADAAVRFRAVRALGSLGKPAAATQAVLAQARHDADADVRWAASQALQRHGLEHTTVSAGTAP